MKLFGNIFSMHEYAHLGHLAGLEVMIGETWHLSSQWPQF